ncbi:hypothetical protein WH47_05312 [Habropoda laboriosa]|uniref:Uncharacterized protein n=1 Tax=Habropoda laboriosa TaxID=597456 RepID=A0A0L7QUT4_9HYME|nr:hypothetical protein WH47_05312 [Habropoda laboriosa]
MELKKMFHVMVVCGKFKDLWIVDISSEFALDVNCRMCFLCYFFLSLVCRLSEQQSR